MTAMRRRRKSPSTVLSLIACGGFIGLLTAAHYDPQGAIALRAMAIIWLMAFGAVKLLIDFSRDA